MNLVDFVSNNVVTDNPLVSAVCIGILFVVTHDFYHYAFGAILSWITKKR